MRKVGKLIVLIAVCFLMINVTYAFFNTETKVSNTFYSTEYQLKLNGCGGKYSSKDVTVKKEDTILPIPNRTGYDFLGYSKSQNGTVEFSNVIPNIDDINNKELYATWNLITYGIAYNLNGGSISNPPRNYNVESFFILPTPTKEGYEFIGWTGTGLSTPTKTVTINNAIGDRYYIANWQIIGYSISYNLNGGFLSGESTSYTINSNITIPKPTKTGYEFVGWTGTDLNTPTKNVILNGEIGDRSYTANWSKIEYNISYELNGGTLINPPNSYTLESNIELPTPTKEGYEFIGWTGTGLEELTKNVILDGDTGDKSYVANWDIKNYKIIYNLNGGSISNQPTSYNINSNITLPTPTRVGAQFLGWTGTGLTGPTQTVTINNSTGDREYTANWSVNTFYVDINSIIQNNVYDGGANGFTFSIWLDDNLVGDHVTDYLNEAVPYGTKVRVYVYDRDGYSVTSFRDQTWTVTDNLVINPTWYDNIAPTITDFQVTNLGYFDPSKGAAAGWNIYIYIDAYDNGTGMQKFQTWLVPYLNASGAGRKDGKERTMENVLYLNTTGRTFCAYAIDNAGNESERCETLYE